MKTDYESKYHHIEQNHWWMKTRRLFTIEILKNLDKDSKILDIGCASGCLISDLINCGFRKENIYGIDISAVAIEKCMSNGISNVFLMDAQHIELNEKFDVLIALDCLEHIKNDREALKNWNSLLKKDGYLIVFVPAFKMLWSSHDEDNMHFRRYTKNELSEKIQNENFEIIKSSYWNLFLFIPILIYRIIFNHKKTKKTIGENNIGDNIEMPNMAINSLLTTLLKFENYLLKFINLPFGVSAFCIAKTKNK